MKKEGKEEEREFMANDICEATMPDESKFSCVLTRRMRGWGFPVWEVRITAPGQRGTITHVRDSQLRLLKAYRRDTMPTLSRM